VRWECTQAPTRLPHPTIYHLVFICSEYRTSDSPPVSRGEQNSMTRGRDGGAVTPPARQRALLAAVVAAIMAVSAAIYVGVAADGATKSRDTLAGGSGARNNPAAPASTGTWVASWATSPVGGEPGTELTGLAGRSVRNVVHTSVG